MTCSNVRGKAILTFSYGMIAFELVRSCASVAQNKPIAASIQWAERIMLKIDERCGKQSL